ncbi:transposable element Tcb1 transposase [Trichonephila clavipes]|nr:transposable element Tcb1 transposase [Trichonephila clavipes]
MPPRWTNENFQQLTEFERGRTIGLREGRFFYRIIGARVQSNSSAVMRVWTQWNDRAPINSKNWQWTKKDKSRLNLWDRNNRICVRRYAGERCLPECVIERHSGLTPGVMVRAQHMQLLPWPAYSPDMSSIEHVWELVG